MSRWRGTVAALALAGVVVAGIMGGPLAAIDHGRAELQGRSGAMHAVAARGDGFRVADFAPITASPTALEDALDRLFAVTGLAVAGAIVSARIRRTPTSAATSTARTAAAGGTP